MNILIVSWEGKFMADYLSLNLILRREIAQFDTFYKAKLTVKLKTVFGIFDISWKNYLEPTT